MSADLPPSANFSFLAAYDAALVVVAARAEQYVQHDPITSPMKLRQFGALLAQQLAARTGLFTSVDESQAELLARFRRKGATAHLQQSILTRAFRGDLVPQDPTDEPASALLSRLGEGPEKPPRRRARAAAG